MSNPTFFDQLRIKLDLWRKQYLSSPSVYVLMYHHVCQPHEDPRYPSNEILVTPDHFREQMRYLKENFSLASTDLFYKSPERLEEASKPVVMVTFDDGYRNILENVSSVMKKHSIPFTVFVTSGYVDGDFTPLELVLYEAMTERDQLKISIDGEEQLLPCGTDTKFTRSLRELYTRVKPLSPERREALYEQLPHSDGNTTKSNRDIFLSWDELRQIKRDVGELVSLQMHGHSHTPFDVLTRSQIQSEIRTSRRLFEEYLNTSPEELAYPHGGFNQEDVDLLKRLDIKEAFTTGDEPIFPFEINQQYSLSRLDVPDANPELEEWQSIFSQFNKQ